MTGRATGNKIAFDLQPGKLFTSRVVPNPNLPEVGYFRRLGQELLRLLGWKLELTLPPVRKFVLIGAPHTSNWDFILMLLARWASGISVHWAGKHTLFRPPFGRWLKWLGGIPVNRSVSQNLVDQLIAQFRQREVFRLIIAPEGTRSPIQRWKSGFYYIALGAKVPIALGYLDFPRKAFGVGGWLMPGGQVEQDLALIRQFYRQKVSSAHRFVAQIRFASIGKNRSV